MAKSKVKHVTEQVITNDGVTVVLGTAQMREHVVLEAIRSYNGVSSAMTRLIGIVNGGGLETRGIARKSPLDADNPNIGRAIADLRAEKQGIKAYENLLADIRDAAADLIGFCDSVETKLDERKKLVDDKIGKLG